MASVARTEAEAEVSGQSRVRTSARSSGSSGIGGTPFLSAAWQAATSRGWTCADTPMIGAVAIPGGRARNRRAASIPDVPGRFTSIRMASKAPARPSSGAASPVSAITAR